MRSFAQESLAYTVRQLRFAIQAGLVVIVAIMPLDWIASRDTLVPLLICRTAFVACALCGLLVLRFSWFRRRAYATGLILALTLAADLSIMTGFAGGFEGYYTYAVIQLFFATSLFSLLPPRWLAWFLAQASLQHLLIVLWMTGSSAGMMNAGFSLAATAVVSCAASIVVFSARRRDFELRMRLDHLATVDGLTGLFNRRHTEEQIDNELARTQRGLQHLGVILFDIDHFKAINDSRGHALGDHVLQQVAQTLSGSLQPFACAGRWGGEEFLLLCPQLTDERQLLRFAERLRAQVEQLAIEVPGQAESDAVRVTISGGVTLVPRGSDANPDQIVQLADAALYQAKQTGRNRVVVSTRATTI